MTRVEQIDRTEGEKAELAATVRAADPFNADALVVLIDAQVELGQYQEAAASLQQLLDLRPALPALARTS
ncbi:MAG: tetratricopeptide repeat protein [Actinobacteria bacterium]|nr:tetratricopeptide repeat protein [Actinomycetota bacterium]